MRWLKMTTFVLAAGTLTHCGANRVGEPFSRQPAIETERQALGQEVFMAHCHQCHPNGEGGLAPALNDKPLPEFLVALQVRQGLGAMPAFPQSVISDDQLGALTNHVAALRQAAQQP